MAVLTNQKRINPSPYFLISAEKKPEVEELFSEIKEESGLFEEFLAIHQRKIGIAKKIIQDWKNGNLDAINRSVEEIYSINRRLWYLINKIISISKKEQSLFYFIIKERMNSLDRKDGAYTRQSDILRKNKYKSYYKKLEPFFKQLFGFLKSLSKVILEQIKVIKKEYRRNQLIVKDLIEKKFFYQLLMDEISLDRKIKQNTVFIIRIINDMLGYEQKTWQAVRTVKGKEGNKDVISKGLVFYEIKDIDSINFDRFYELYEQSFPRIEAESKTILKSFFKYSEVKASIRWGVYRTHLIVGVFGGEIVAFTYFNTVFAKERNIFYAHGWYTAIDKKIRGRGILNKLLDMRAVAMRRDANEFGFDNIDALFIDVNDPRKMNKMELEECRKKYKEDPKKNFLVWRALGFFPVKFEHIAPSTGGDKKPVHYQIFMIKPLKSEWLAKGGIPLEDMKSIIYYEVKWLYDQPLTGNKVYSQLLKNVENAQVNGLVKFGWQ
ncbi:hypothetical protein HYX06_03290 [Candidatus Woesearchaeota archaeon]|nr:hypothetical protein [Candidatus Woesearchaeota archaeon]